MKPYFILFIALLIQFPAIAQFDLEEHVIYDETHFSKDFNQLISADLDGDGHLDLITFSSETFVLAWQKSINSSGNFEVRRIIDQISTVNILYPVDMDGDGDLDILAGIGGNSSRSGWYENLDGFGNFSDNQRIPVQFTLLGALAHGDIDGDGDQDVVAAGGFITRNLEWYQHLDGQGEFSDRKIIISDINGIFWIALVDIDGDGDNDCLLYTSPSPRDRTRSRMPSSA